MASPQGAKVVVIGGGPAGSTASTLIAQHGHRVQLFERERFPRFHIGESLIPETYWVLKRLDMLPKMQGSHFVKKYSVQFVGAVGPAVRAVLFSWITSRTNASQTWQVRRSEFDQLMLDNAREHGVDVQEGVRVLEVLFDGQRAVGVRIADADGVTREVRADVVVDASGQSSMIISRLGLRTGIRCSRRPRCGPIGKVPIATRAATRGPRSSCKPRQAGLVLVHPAARQHRQRRHRGRIRLLFKNRENKEHETIYFEEVEGCPDSSSGSATPAVTVFLRRQGIFLSLAPGGGRRLGAGRRRVRISRSALFLRRAAGAEIGQLAADAVVDGLANGDTSARNWENGSPISSAGWIACGGWCANTTRVSASAGSSRHPQPQGTSHRSVDRRPVQGQPGRGLRADRRHEDRAGRPIRLRRA